ncbi:enoyl-CoA delta isomerase 2-like [Amphiura filiformis]|uniref:enoyl-CoA delta isomerase 2-like n=1 Tax=Amphiura filiformis TaxID=82378 RepID=UPI003B224DDB
MLKYVLHSEHSFFITKMAAYMRRGVLLFKQGQQIRMANSIASRRLLHHSVRLWAVSDTEFQAAKDRVGTLTQDPGNDVKLKMYALFKQATIGPCNAPKPGAFDFVGKAKWSAWNDLGQISQDDAKQTYVDLINDLLAKEGGGSTVETAATEGAFEGIKVTTENGVCTIMLNRPHKKNALTLQTYEEIGQALETAGQDNSVVVAVLTGTGDYYCSGNDLNNFMNVDPSNMKQMAKEGGVILEKFVNAFVDFPKPLIGAINGPAVGVSVTTMGLFDVVYATDKATFHTPFSSLGQSPEGCSSYVFPKIMGSAKANEVLLFGRKLTAQEACDNGLVTAVFPDSTFKAEVQKRIEQYSKLPRNSMRLSKNLIREVERDTLYKVNKAECTLLVERWTSEECIQAIMAFFSEKSKL